MLQKPSTKQPRIKPRAVFSGTNSHDNNCVVQCEDFSVFLEKIEQGSVDLILTDPPYTISRRTGFKDVRNGVKRFAVSMEFGEWDEKQIDLDDLSRKMYSVLRRGGTAIVWYDVWKLSQLSTAMNKAGFSMLRLIIWQKTNPVPLNMRATYLSNSREIAVVGVKDGSPTFNGKYDSAIYSYPIPRHNGQKIHPTQKPLDLFSELIEKHSNLNNLVVDPFLGSGTTAIAAIKKYRRFKGCDINNKYIFSARSRIQAVSKITMVDLFLDLADPDNEGFSRAVYVDEFKGKYSRLQMGNGGSWCRDDGSLAKSYNIKRHIEKNAINYVKLDGFKKTPAKEYISSQIRKALSSVKCAVLHAKNSSIDCKDGRRDDKKILNHSKLELSKLELSDFQSLSKAAKNVKRQHCNECRATNQRFDAKKLGYHVSQIKGKSAYQGTCVGCYWYDPYAFNQAVSKDF